MATVSREFEVELTVAVFRTVLQTRKINIMC